MPRFALLVAALLSGASAFAQDAAQNVGSTVDFMLRPTQPADGSDDFWRDQLRADEPDDGTIGPPLAGPTGDEPIGPPLAGPAPPEPEEPVRRPRRPEDEPDLFAATGIRIGTFVIRPAIEVGVNVSDNPAEEHEKEAGIGLIVAPEINIRSEDERHEIEADLRGEAIVYGDEELNERDAEARLRARYDLTSRTSVEAELGYDYSLDRFTDPDTPEAAVERPPVETYSAALGVTQRAGRIAFTLMGTIEHEKNDDVELADGGTASREELDNTEYGLEVRTSYEASLALRPFVAGAGGRRTFDQKEDDSGFERSSSWGELRGGILVDFGAKLSGEASLGYRYEDLDDDRLEDLNGVVAAAAILWSPRRLTDVRFELSTEVQPTSIPDASGSMLYAGELSVARRLGPRLRAEVGADVEYERFVGLDRHDWTFGGFAELAYAFNRTASVLARYAYEATRSTDADADTDENVVSVRVRIQR
jgi:hypothetical protein